MWQLKLKGREASKSLKCKIDNKRRNEIKNLGHKYRVVMKKQDGCVYWKTGLMMCMYSV